MRKLTRDAGHDKRGVEREAGRRYHSRVPAAARLGFLVLLAPPPSAAAQSQWRVEPPLEAHQTAVFGDARVTESSGVAVSRRSPGVLWTHNDSGNPPYLFATDTTGAVRGTFSVTGARNVDWEDIALGPCEGGSCLYLADTGDNRERRTYVAVYRVPEPDLPADRPKRVRPTARAHALIFRYPDGPHDVEAMWVSPAGDVHLVTKGSSDPVRHYRLPAAAWTSVRPVVAELVQQLPLSLRSKADLVTGASLSPDGRIVAVRTYGAVYFFFLAPRTGRLEAPPASPACDALGLGIQGEGVGWLDDEVLVLTSERAVLPAGTIAVTRCDLPEPGARR